jgi:hypothetical protein
MLVEHSNDKMIHANHIFTDLFHLLKKFNHEDIHLNYSNSDLNKMILHADNAITGLLHGLQAMGNLVALSTLIDKEEMCHLGNFLTLLANLMEALTILRADCELPICDDEPGPLIMKS